MYCRNLIAIALACPLLACSGMSVAQTGDGTVTTPTEPPETPRNPDNVGDDEGDQSNGVDVAESVEGDSIAAIVDRTIVTALPEGLRPCAAVSAALYPTAEVELPPLLWDAYVSSESLASLFGMAASNGPQRAEVVTHIVDTSSGVMWRLVDSNGDGEVDESSMEVRFDERGRVTHFGATRFGSERTLIYGEFGVVQVAESAVGVTWDFQYTNGVVTRVNTNHAGARVGVLDIVRTPTATVYTATRSADSAVVVVQVERYDSQRRLIAVDRVQHEPYVSAQQERWHYVEGDPMGPDMADFVPADLADIPSSETDDWTLPATSSGWLEEHFASADSPTRNSSVIRTAEVDGALVEDTWLSGNDAPFSMVRTRVEPPAWSTTVMTHQYSNPPMTDVTLEQWYCGPLGELTSDGPDEQPADDVEVVAVSPSWIPYADIRHRLERQLAATPPDLDEMVRAEADRLGSSPSFDAAFEQYADQRLSLASDDANANVEALQNAIAQSATTVNALDDVIDTAALAACAQLLSGQLLLSLADAIKDAPDSIGDDAEVVAAYEQALSAYLDQFHTEARNRFDRVGQMRQTGLVDGYCAETSGVMLDVDIYDD